MGGDCTEYKVEVYKLDDYNGLRTIKVKSLPSKYWFAYDLADAAMSEDMWTKILNLKEKSYIRRTAIGVFELETDGETIILDDSYSYHFDGGNLIGYMQNNEAILITEPQFNEIFNVKDSSKAVDLKWWWMVHSGAVTVKEMQELIAKGGIIGS